MESFHGTTLLTPKQIIMKIEWKTVIRLLLSLLRRGGKSEVERHESGAERHETEAESQESEVESHVSCPMATRRAIVEGVAEIRKFAEEHQLAASVVRALLTLLAQLALSSLHGKVNGQILDVMLRALRYEQERWLPESADDGLPHISGSSAVGPDGNSIFDIARGEW